jgi:hypothetical protein
MDVDTVFSMTDFEKLYFANGAIEFLLKKCRNVRICHKGVLGVEYDGYRFFALGFP